MRDFWLASSFINMLGLLLLAATAEAATYHVATDGVDAPGCGSQSTPCRHLSYAARLMSSGDTMAILPGTYADHLYAGSFDPLPSGAASQPTVVKAADGYGTVTIVPDGVPPNGGGIDLFEVSYIVLDGLILDGHGISLGAADHITIQNSEIKNDPGQGIGGHAEYLSVLNCKIHHNGSDPSQLPGYNPDLLHGIYVTGSDSRFIGNDIYSNTGQGITLHDSGYRIPQNNNVIANNNVHNNGGGIQFTNGANVRIYNNLLWNGGGIGIGGRDTKVYNNTLSGTEGIYLPSAYAGTADVQNNLLAGGNIGDENGQIAYPSSNLLDAGSQLANPISNGGSSCKGATCCALGLCTTATPPDLHLKSTASLAIDKGMALPEVTTDFDGVSRPQGSGYDIGAYEFKVGGALRGDLDGNGTLELTDVRWSIEMLVGTRPINLATADLTGDGVLALADVQALIRLMVGP